MPDCLIKIILAILAIFAIGFLYIVGCEHGPDKTLVIENAIRNSPHPGDFGRLFPGGKHEINFM